MVKIIENYTLHEQIGEGEYGKVYRGVDSKTKREVAVKVINISKFKENPKLEECTLNQIEVLSKIDSPFIVRFIEILKTANNFYFFYEYCNEGTLEAKIRKHGRLSEQQVLSYLAQIMEAFRILAARNIMHRDLKPGNILMHDGKIKVADFGFCKSLESNKDLAQTMLGSPIYMAPEVLKGEIYTVKADIWSLGVVLYECLYGFCPFQQSSIARLISLLEDSQVSFNREINSVSPALEELIRKMLTKDPQRRISWQQILAYRISPDGSEFFKPASVAVMGELRENKTYTNSNVSVVKQSQEKENHLQPDKRQAYSQDQVFKKKPAPQPSYSQNKENMSGLALHPHQLQAQSETTSNDWIKKQHLRLVNAMRCIHECVQNNYFPDATTPLCLKLLLILQKELCKMLSSAAPQKRDIFARLSSQLSDTIRLFSQSVAQNSSGQSLQSYLTQLQRLFPLSSEDTSKETLVHILELLDFNNLEQSKSRAEKTNMSREALISQITNRYPLNQL